MKLFLVTVRYTKAVRPHMQMRLFQARTKSSCRTLVKKMYSPDFLQLVTKIRINEIGIARDVTRERAII